MQENSLELLKKVIKNHRNLDKNLIEMIVENHQKLNENLTKRERKR